MVSNFSIVALVATLITSGIAAPPARGYNGTHPHKPQPTASSPSAYKQVAEFSHPNFFDGFTLFDQGDPTWGDVTYVNQETAKQKELLGWVYYEDDKVSNAYVGLDHQGKSLMRDSVRLVSNQRVGPGSITVIDVRHAPTGPSLWPAVWLLAPAEEGIWPTAGEIDIMEWVNDVTYNSMTLHTSSGCTVDNDPSAMLGTLQEADCSTGSENGPGTVGCSIQAPKKYTVNGKSMATAGAEFNKQGGGIYVHEWTTDGMAMWLFPRDDLPADLAAGKPHPKTWKQKPLAKFSGKGCDFTKAFKPQQLIINITLCGQWAGKVFGNGGTNAWAQCNDFVTNNPSAFNDAFFDFASIKMYSSSESQSQPASVQPESVEPESCDE